MRQRDPLVQTLLAFFVPFYLIYWLYVTAKNLAQISKLKAPNIWLLLAPGIIIGVTLLILFVGVLSGSDEGTLFGGAAFIIALLLMVPLSFALSLVYYYKFGGLTEKVTGEQTSRIMVFVLLWLIAPVVVYIVQEKLNAIIAKDTPGQPAGQIPQPPELPKV